jgi:hypothetical protein
MTINFEAEKRAKKDFAAKHRYSIVLSQNLWRVCKKQDYRTLGEYTFSQVALCTGEWDAIDVAFALAMVDAGARIPEPSPDPLGQALNEGDGVYRP